MSLTPTELQELQTIVIDLQEEFPHNADLLWDAAIRLQKGDLGPTSGSGGQPAFDAAVADIKLCQEEVQTYQRQQGGPSGGFDVAVLQVVPPTSTFPPGNVGEILYLETAPNSYIATDQIVIDPVGPNSVQMDEVGTTVFRTVPAASGGVEINNLVTGAGFERVLTVSDFSAVMTPLEILGDINTATPPVAEAITCLLNFRDLQDVNTIGSVGYNAQNDLRFENFMLTGNMEFVVADGIGPVTWLEADIGTNLLINFTNLNTRRHVFSIGTDLVRGVSTQDGTNPPTTANNHDWDLTIVNNLTDFVSLLQLGLTGGSNAEFPRCFIEGQSLRARGTRTGGGTANFTDFDPDASVEISHPANNDSVFLTTTALLGGLTANNLATGAGFERVLTESDLGFVIDQHGYQFSTSTSMFDPGAGFLRFNNATPASITQFDISDLPTNGVDIDTDVLENVEIGSTLRVVDAADLTVFLTFTVTSLFDGGGFHIFGVEHKSGTIIPANNANITVEISQAPYFDMSVASSNGSVMVYDTTTDQFNSTEARGTITRPGVGITQFGTSDSQLLLTSASRVSTSVQLQVAEQSATNALILSFDSTNYEIGTGATSAAHLDLSAHAGALSVRINRGSTLMLAEVAASLADIATYGQIWVRNDAPNTLMFTDDAGNESVIGGNLFIGLPASTGVSNTLIGDGSGGWVENNAIQLLDAGTTGQVVVAGQAASTVTSAAFFSTQTTGDRFLFGASSADDADTFGISWNLNASDPNETLTFEWLTYGSQIPLMFRRGDTSIHLDDSRIILQNGSMFLLETAAGNLDRSTYGQFWVSNAATQVPMFTDEAGVDSILNAAGATPALQAVTVVGNTTDQGMTIEDGGVFQINESGDVDQVTMEVETTTLAPATALVFAGNAGIEAYQFDELINCDGTGVHLPTTGRFALYRAGDSVSNFISNTSGELTATSVAAAFRFNCLSLRMQQVAAPDTNVASYGQLWVDNEDPTRLRYTDDTDDDFVVAISGGQVGGNVTVNNSFNFNTAGNFADNWIGQYFDGGNDTITLEDSTSTTNWPLYTTINIIAPGSGVLTVTEGSGTTLFNADGSDTVGGVTISQGVASITRQTTANYIVWGSGIT